MKFIIILLVSQSWNGGETLFEPSINFNSLKECNEFGEQFDKIVSNHGRRVSDLAYMCWPVSDATTLAKGVESEQ